MAFVSPNERQFWVELIDKYLYPIDNDKAEQVTLNHFCIFLFSTQNFLNARSIIFVTLNARDRSPQMAFLPSLETPQI